MKISFILIFGFVLINVLEQHRTKYLLVEVEGNASPEIEAPEGTFIGAGYVKKCKDGICTESCKEHITWAFETGKAYADEHYPELEMITGAKPQNATFEDFQRYFKCKNVHRASCNDKGLEFPLTCSHPPCDQCSIRLADKCQDQEECSAVTDDICKKFPGLNQTCPVACRSPMCNDPLNCESMGIVNGMGSELCKFEPIKNYCPIGCATIQNPEVGFFDGKRCGARCLLPGNGLRRPGLRNSEGRCLDEVDLTILGCKRAETNDKGFLHPRGKGC